MQLSPIDANPTSLERSTETGVSPAIVVFVDDERAVLDAIRRTLARSHQNWDARFAKGVGDGLRIAEEARADVIVTDMKMPGLTGLDLLERLRDIPSLAGVPVVMLTGDTDAHLKRQALELGALDLLAKPIAADDLVARISSALRLRATERRLRDVNLELEQRVRERTEELERSKLDIVWRLARATELRDEDTGAHVYRVASCCHLLAKEIGLDANHANTIYYASTLHDAGKIGVPDSILRKTGPLTPQERAIIETHCEIGREILGQSIATHTSKHVANDLLDVAAEIAYTHHERWDGGGYPLRRAGDDIPLSGRIVAIADVLDALTHARPYKPAFTFDRASEIIREEAGKHFDPEIVEAFSRLGPQLRDLMACEEDEGPSIQEVAA